MTSAASFRVRSGVPAVARSGGGALLWAARETGAGGGGGKGPGVAFCPRQSRKHLRCTASTYESGRVDPTGASRPGSGGLLDWSFVRS